MTSFGYNVLGFGVGGGPRYTSQVFSFSVGVSPYTPSDDAKSALFMVFGAVGSQPSSGNDVPNSGGGGGYAEKYVSSLSSSYPVTITVGGTTSAGGATVISSGNYNMNPGYGSAGDFLATGGYGATGNPYNTDARGGTAAGGSRCGTGGNGLASGTSTPGAPGAIGNNGNEVSGVFDLSPYGITFAYTRTANYGAGSGVPVFTSTGRPEEDTLASHCDIAAVGGINTGVPGWTGGTGYAGSVLIIEFY